MSERQKAYLINALETHSQLVSRKFTQKFTKNHYDAGWKKLADRLNQLGEVNQRHVFVAIQRSNDAGLRPPKTTKSA